MSDYVIIVGSLLLVAFFSGIEIAFLSSNKFRIELENKQGKYAARILSYFIKSPSKFICTILVGINIGLVIYGTYMASLLEPVIKEHIPFLRESESLIVLLQTIISTLLMLIAGSFCLKYFSGLILTKRFRFFRFLFYCCIFYSTL